MAKLMNMMKQAASLKKMQKKLSKKKVECSSPGGEVSVTARGDMSVSSISIDPEQLKAANPRRLEKQIVSTVNSALDSAKKMAAGEMAKMTGGMGGLADMLGG